MPTIDEIIFALECSNTEGKHDTPCETCPYNHKGTDEDWKNFAETLKKHGEKIEDYPADFLDGCDCERIGLDAAVMLRQLSSMNITQNGKHNMCMANFGEMNINW